MRLLVIGGRHLDDVALIRRSLNAALKRHPVEVLIHGGHAVLGATSEEIARDHGLHIVRYPANWRRHGQAAESIRNRFMLADSRPDIALALPGGEDTLAFVQHLRAAGVTVLDPDALACAAQPQPSRPPSWAVTLRPNLT